MQYKPIDDIDININTIEQLLRKKEVISETLVICPELSLQSYICLEKDKKLFKKAITLESEIIKKIKNVSIKYNIYLCITIFENLKDRFFNTAIIFSPKGRIIKKYHKINIPSEICYQEKYYFDQPKNSYKYFKIKGFKIGILICWDQWHADSYLKLNKKDVNLIVCPTAIGSCKYKNLKVELKGEKKKWLEVIKSNSLMNNIPVVVSNRTGKESFKNSSIDFWGTSFLTDAHGTIKSKCTAKPEILSHRYSLKDQISAKKMWNFIDIKKLNG